ncbi:MAG: methyl-accepting chemotaxis protein [Phycisphaerales bacterium]
MHLKNLRLTWKLALLCGLPIAGLATFAAVTYQTINQVRVQGPAYDQIILGKDLIADILPPPAYVIETDQVVLQMLSTQDQASLDGLIQRTQQQKRDYDARISYWTEHLPDSAMKEQLLGASQDTARKYFALLDNDFLPAVRRHDLDTATSVATGPMHAAFEQHREAINQVVKLATDFASHNEQDAAALLAARNQLLWTVAGVAGLLSLALGWLLVQNVRRPLADMLATVDGVTGGRKDLASRVDEARKDELGLLGAGVNRFISKLEELMTHTADAADDLGKSSVALNELSASMNERMEKQTSRVREIAAAVTEMSASAAEVARQAADAARASEESGSVARAGGDSMRTSIAGMDDIRSAVQASTQRVHALGKRSESIGEMIKVINDIAEQTNLLALNAAIEAARAGEHGRGFAVVADEVRKLADRTTKATEEISQSIRQIQDETRQVVQSMDTGVAKVEEGASLSVQAGDSLEKIVASSTNVNRMIAAIATASDQQSGTTEELSRSLEEIVSINHAAHNEQETLASVSAKAATLRSVVEKSGLKLAHR